MRLAACLAACFAAGGSLLGSGPAQAAEVTQSVTVNAPPAKVWRLVGPFAAISAWLPGAASSPADHGNAVGSTRIITLNAPGHPKVVERLTDYGRDSYTYAITSVDPHVLPVSGYTSTISVAPSAAGSTLTWHGSFAPAGGASAADAEKAVSGLYRAGLDNAKKMAER